MNCFMCKGSTENGIVNHVVDINGAIIIIKNVPANVCSQCGEVFFDNEVAKKIEIIVEQAKENHAEITIINYRDKAA
ncbi:MAG TPA: type II toxin-antitoxin system MqsA family antitoxin [Clostridiales bacterium]|nr:MAG: hypothetical protein A2Y22_03620 [Clostridiales bacterium GWD2_32_59]HAN09683.1 type II toxin-antitoxin system MqsA family antitoxin [Clostridiales bacterium]